MTITVNNQPLTYKLELEQTMGEILGAIEAACKKENETIVSIVVDGKELKAGELDAFFLQPVQNGYSIALTTVSGTQVCNYMQETIKRLETHLSEFEQISVLMQTGNEAKVLSLLEQFSTQLNELYRCFLLFDITGIPVDLLIENKPLHDYQKEIAALMQDIISGIEEQDIIQVSDLAEYELGPLVKTLLNGVSYILV